MRLSRIATSLILFSLIFLPIACGVSSPPTVAGPCDAPATFSSPGCTGRCLASITVCPGSADPHTAGGEVQFTATGNFTAPPWAVTPQPARWGVCQNNNSTTAALVSSQGLAKCASGATGTYTVFAYDMTDCNALTVCGGGCTISGTAQLTCP